MGPRAFIRRHPPPAPRAAAELQQLVRAQGFPDFDMSSSGALQASLLRLGEQGVSQDTIRAIIALCTHPMRPAAYLAAGSVDSMVHWRHFALNIPTYTHFTSPIRRCVCIVCLPCISAGPPAYALTPIHPPSSPLLPTQHHITATRTCWCTGC